MSETLHFKLLATLVTPDGDGSPGTISLDVDETYSRITYGGFEPDEKDWSQEAHRCRLLHGIGTVRDYRTHLSWINHIRQWHDTEQVIPPCTQYCIGLTEQP